MKVLRAGGGCDITCTSYVPNDIETRKKGGGKVEVAMRVHMYTNEYY